MNSEHRPTALEVITLALLSADLYTDTYDDCTHGAQFILDMLHEQGFRVQRWIVVKDMPSPLPPDTDDYQDTK